jgi:cobalt-precorrin-6B (C15)-methyltransferase
MWKHDTPGIPDSLFDQDEAVPGPTKEEVRVITICKAHLCRGQRVLDVGCGTGSLTVEAALQVAPTGTVFAIDEDEKAVELTRKNVVKFAVQDYVHVTRGKAPEDLFSLPMVDAVLVGGGASTEGALEAACRKLKVGGRIVVNAIMLESACKALEELRRLGMQDVEATLVSVAKGKAVTSGTMMMARNPVVVISATKAEVEAWRESLSE